MRPALGDQQRSALAGRVDGERLSVDQADTGCARDRHRAAPPPGRRRRRPGAPPRSTSPDRHRVVTGEQDDAPLGHRRRTGHRIDHLAVGDRRGDQVVDDREVHLFDGRRLFVVVVEGAGRRGCRRPTDDGSCGGRPARPVEERSGLGRDQLGTGRPEPDDVDPRLSVSLASVGTGLRRRAADHQPPPAGVPPDADSSVLRWRRRRRDHGQASSTTRTAD